MKRFLIIFNVVLLVAVGVLYFLYFTYVREDLHQRKAAEAQVANSFKVAYFDFDTLETYYELSKKVRADLIRVDSINQSILSGLQKKFGDKVNEIRSLGSAVSQTQQSAYQQQLDELRNEYQQKQQELGQQQQTEFITKQNDVKNHIQNYLKEYSHDKGYAYVFATKEYDDFVYYKDTIRNITFDILKGLNQAYANEKKK